MTYEKVKSPNLHLLHFQWSFKTEITFDMKIIRREWNERFIRMKMFERWFQV